MHEITTRVAPSPTGLCHLGTARTALYSYLVAKKAGSKFIIRMEDTDIARSKKEYEDDILASLEWLGIKSDVPIIRQSERASIYKKYVQILLDKGLAYKCYCTAEELEKKREDQLAAKEKPLYDRTCDGMKDQPGKPFVVRFRVEDHGGVQWRDLVLGRINVRKAEISDFIIQRQDGSVGYLLANMIDDALQGVTHIVRGIDGMANAPAQIMLFEALGFPVPNYAHTPFIHNEKGEKLSKRNGAASVMEYRNMGILPEAMVNALVRIGWSHGNDEIFSMEDLIEKFDLNNVGKAPGSMDMNKFHHINKHWLKVADPNRLADLIFPFLKEVGVEGRAKSKGHPFLVNAIKTLQTRAKTLKEMAEMAKFYYISDFEMERALSEQEKKWVICALDYINTSDFTATGLNTATVLAMDNCGTNKAQLLPALRMALSGKSCSPGVVEIMEVLGKEETCRRISAALVR